MNDYVQIKKNNLFVTDKNGVKIKLPTRVEYGTRNYRYDFDRQILQKRCAHCNIYFDTDQIIDGTFVDIHDETKIKEHNGKSEMYSRCVKCHEELKEEQVKREVQKLGIDVPIITNVESSIEPQVINENDTNGFLLTKENMQYIKVVAILKNRNAEQYLNDVVDTIRKHNHLRIEFEENIK